MYPILWVLQFTRGKSVVQVLLTPPQMCHLASNCVSYSFIEAVNHLVIVPIHKIVMFLIGLISLPLLIY